MDANGVIQFLATALPTAFWATTAVDAALINLGLVDDDEEEEEQSSEEQEDKNT
jgi:hypothetical protein